MKKQIIKLNPELIDQVENNGKRATTRLGLKTRYHLGPVLFQNSEAPLDILDNNFEIQKIEAISYCDLSEELAHQEGYKNGIQFRKALREIYGPIDDYATCTVIHFDR